MTSAMSTSRTPVRLAGRDKWQLVLLGQGEVPVQELLALLPGAGYDGWVSLEFERKWHPELGRPDVALRPQIALLREWLAPGRHEAPGRSAWAWWGAASSPATYAAAVGRLDGACLVAVTDIDQPPGRGSPPPTAWLDASLPDLLARDDVDVVCVCVPSGLHAEIGLAAARAGKHLVVEKPIDISLDAARGLIDGAAAAGVSLNVISQQRYNPGVRRAKTLLDQGRLGRPMVISATVPWYRSQAYYNSAAWRGTWAQ